MFSQAPARLVAIVAVGLLIFVTGFGMGRGSRAPDPDLALVGEARERIEDMAMESPTGEALRREAIVGMLEAIEDGYAEYLPRHAGGSEPEDIEHRVLGVRVGALSDASGLRGRVVETGVGHVSLGLFTPGSGALLRAEVERLYRLGVEGVILDLRGNPGGLLDEALEVSGAFLGERDVLLYETATGGDGARIGIGEKIDGGALVVLVDERTASAAELVAGAVQDHGVGLVVGERTSGKATIQRVVSLSDGSAIKLTTAEYRTPTGRRVDGTGIRPDVVVDLPRDEQLARAATIVRSMIGE